MGDNQRHEKEKTLSSEIKNMILQDIVRCEEAIENPAATNALYHELIVRYEMIDKDFQRGMPNFAKTFNSNYLTEIKLIKTKLEMYIALDEIPITYDGNAAQNATVTIIANKVSNKGNIGTGNNFQKEMDASLSVTRESKSGFFSWLKKKLCGGK